MNSVKQKNVREFGIRRHTRLMKNEVFFKFLYDDNDDGLSISHVHFEFRCSSERSPFTCHSNVQLTITLQNGMQNANIYSINDPENNQDENVEQKTNEMIEIKWLI